MRHFTDKSAVRSTKACAGSLGGEVSHKQTACTVCHDPLAPGERKVHRGLCARRRKTYLQRLQRWRRRR